mgnify:CR=1 FL=1|tara:strand:+ start:1633 stop:2520 length:888 start_codon:yes stop_codon:yes gene_type:complete
MLPKIYIPLLAVVFILLLVPHRRHIRNVVNIIHGKLIYRESENYSTSGPIISQGPTGNNMTNFNYTLKAVPNDEFVQKHTVFRKPPIKKNLIFITTHMSRYHQIYLKECWVKLLKKRKIIKDADIMIFTTKTPQWLHEIFPTAIIKKYKNPGYQEGANLALQKLMKYKWYDGYEWVIRLNPDVIIKSDDWLLRTMQNPKIHGIFDDCLDTGCKTSYCTSNMVHTDFFAVRASQMNENMFNNTIHQNAEKFATKEFSEIIRLGHDAWIPRTTFYKGACRVVSDIIIHDDDVSKCLK